MLAREETIKAFECCYMSNSCEGCPFDGQEICSIAEPEVNRAVMHYLKENEPAPATTGTSSEVSKDTNSTQFDDSILLDICQEGLEEISKIALDGYPGEYLTGYIEAFKDSIQRLRGEQSD